MLVDNNSIATNIPRPLARGAALVPLSELDLEDLADSDTWLDDRTINSAMSLISEINPELDGLQDTILGAAGFYSVAKRPFVQIVHTGTGHWVCASNVFAEHEDEVLVYDSAESTPSCDVVRQIDGEHI